MTWIIEVHDGSRDLCKHGYVIIHTEYACVFQGTGCEWAHEK